MNIEFAGLTDVGRKRDHNEDHHATDQDLGLYIVCDGMGGHAAGEVASEIAVDTVRSVLTQNREVIAALEANDTPNARDAVASLVEKAVEAACANVYEEAQRDAAKKGMGTTLEMVLVVNHLGIMGHVGDSRLYMKRGSDVHQLSEDHSFVREMVRAGKMSEEEAHHSPMGNLITRAIGIQPTVQVDTLVFDILPGDTLLLCSDGLSDYVENEAELAGWINEASLEDTAARLIGVANERGGKDNITTVLVRGLGDEASHDHDTVRARDVNLKIETLKKVRLFKHLSYKELVVLVNRFEVQVHDAGAELIREGERNGDFYVVLHGGVTVTRQGHDLAHLVAGDHFGEMELVAARPRSATVTTTSKTGVLTIGRDDFVTLLKASEHLAVKLLWSFVQTLSARLHHSNERLAEAEEWADEDIPAPF